MKYQVLFSGKTQKSITNLSTAELAKRVVKVKALFKFVAGILKLIFVLFFRERKMTFHMSAWQTILADSSHEMSILIFYYWPTILVKNLNSLSLPPVDVSKIVRDEWQTVQTLIICHILWHLGPVVQSVVSLTSSLRVISLTVLEDSIYSILIFFAEKM